MKLAETEETNNTELQSIDGSANQTNNSGYGIEVKDAEEVHYNGTEPVEGTPFTIVTIDGKSAVTLGGYRLGELMSLEEARVDAERFDWERIMQVVTAQFDFLVKKGNLNN